MAEINFYDGTICIIRCLISLLAQEAPDKIHAPRGSALRSLREEKAYKTRFRADIQGSPWTRDADRSRAIVISIIYSSGENGA